MPAGCSYWAAADLPSVDICTVSGSGLPGGASMAARAASQPVVGEPAGQCDTRVSLHHEGVLHGGVRTRIGVHVHPRC
ncbi:MAG: hypothetical protein ACRDSL_13390 [Pseudonocardiaceae bacterium]